MTVITTVLDFHVQYKVYCIVLHPALTEIYCDVHAHEFQYLEDECHSLHISHA